MLIRLRTNVLPTAGLVAGLALTPAQAHAQAPDSGAARPADGAAELPASLALPASPQVDEAQLLARAGRHAEAAERLMAAFQATGDDRLLYHAGRERVAAGQHALALRCFQQVLARRGSGDEALRRHLEGQIALAKSRTAAVRLRVLDRRTGQPLPPHVLAQTQLTARATGPAGASEISLPGYDGEPLWLDPGLWSVLLRPPGYRPVELRRSPLWGAGEETWDVAVVPEQVPVTLRVSPTRALRAATMRLTPTGGAPAQPIERPLDRGETTLVLTGGSWQLDVTARRHEGHLPFVVTPRMAPVHLRLHKTPRPRGREFERNEKFLITAGATFFAELFVGSGLALAGSIKRTRMHDRNEAALQSALVDDATGDADGKPGLEQVEATYSTASYHRDLARSMNLETAGIAVMMSGVAALVPAISVAERARHRAVYIELGVGAAALAGGAAWLATTLHDRTERLAVDDPTRRVSQADLRPLVAHNLGASMLTGLGAGLTLFSAVALASDAGKRRRRSTGVAPLAAPGLAGVVLRGRF